LFTPAQIFVRGLVLGAG